MRLGSAGTWWFAKGTISAVHIYSQDFKLKWMVKVILTLHNNH